ncbi:MAG TPA: DUF5818 domain-containing protein [Candidatus Limnocylindria bacterium]|nr:DUF5818 domain-containing protein [Candidatus Limnocylindria bacterium]
MTRPLAVIVLVVLAAASRCQEPGAPPVKPPPKAGDFIRLRGTLSEDVDCRLLRGEDGRVYSLSARLQAYHNGSRVCIHGTLVEISQCLTQPTIDVQAIRPWSSCP